MNNKGFTLVELLLVIVFFAFVLGVVFVPGIYGLYLAFKASILLGIVVMIVQPSPTILGWVAIFGHPEVCHKIVTWLSIPF
jgi:prepilin-type N-terminal cleavage/methylation domain-containing protein